MSQIENIPGTRGRIDPNMFIASVTQDLTRSGKKLGSYTVNLGRGEWAGTIGALRQVGPVVNNMLCAQGAFETEESALAAMIDWIGVSCAIVEDDNGGFRVVAPKMARWRRAVASTPAMEG